MRRALALALFGLLLLGAALALGWGYLVHAGPEVLRQRLEARLSEALATQVALGPVRLGIDRDGLELTGSELRAFPSDAGDALVADEVEIQVDLWAALAGEVRVRGLELARPTLRLRRTAAGVALDAPARAAEPGGGPSSSAGAPAASPPWYTALANALPRLSVTGARVVVVDGAGPGRELAIEGLDGSLLRRWLRGGVALEAEGAVTASGDPAGHLRVTGEAGERSSWTFDLEELALAPLAPLLGARVSSLAPRGRVSGRVRLEGGDAGPRQLRVALRAAKLQATPEIASSRMPIALSDVRIDTQASQRGASWSAAGELDLSGLHVPYEAEVGEHGLARLVLRGVDLAALGPLAEGLAEPERSRARSALANLHGGRLEQLELTREPGAGGKEPRLRATWRIAGASLDAGRESRLGELSFEGSYDGDVLELKQVRALLDGQPLPELDVRLAGLANIRGTSELRCVEPAPASALPGRRPLAGWIAGNKEPGSPTSWRRLRIQAAWLEHPALLCAVERLQGEMVPDPASRGVQVNLERAVWAGAPVRGTAVYRALPEEQLSLRVEIGPPFEPTQPELRRSGWARGSFEFETTSLDRFKTHGASGSFLAQGTNLRLEGVSLRLDPGPELRGSIDLDLSQSDRVPFELQADVRNGRLQDVYASGGWNEGATGALVGSAHLQGALRPGSPVLGDARGSASLHARDGVIRQPFRLFLAVAMASETLNPFRERGTIRYGAMDAELRLLDGAYVFDTFSVDGPALRAAAHGRIGAIGAHEAQMVMGLFFFRTLDNVIGRLPLLNRIFLGKDENLIGAYVALTGPWDQMQARVIPTKTLMRGPVSFVFEGLPSFVRGSLERVQAMLPTAAPPPEKKEDS